MERVLNLRGKDGGVNKEAGQENEDISWEADMSAYSSPTWQRGLVIFLSVFFVFLILFKQGISSVTFFGLLIFVLIISLRLKPKKMTVSLGKDRFHFGNRIIPYKEFHSFWISYESGGLQELSLRQKKWHSLYIKIPIIGQNPIQIRGFLIKYVPEEKHEDSIFDLLGRKFGV